MASPAVLAEKVAMKIAFFSPADRSPVGLYFRVIFAGRENNRGRSNPRGEDRFRFHFDFWMEERPLQCGRRAPSRRNVVRCPNIEIEIVLHTLGVKKTLLR